MCSRAFSPTARPSPRSMRRGATSRSRSRGRGPRISWGWRAATAMNGSSSWCRASWPAGPRIYNLFPLLVGTVAAWRRELPRIARMSFDWVYVNPFHETGGSGSLYAVRDPFRLDPRFRDDHAGSDDDQIRAFAEDAASHGLKVMADLVINHTADDAPLARERPDVYVRDENGQIASPFAIDPDDPSKK